MGTPVAHARELARAGRFREALPLLPSTTTDPAVQVFKAEMLERNGRIKEARTLCDWLLAGKKIDSKSRARLLVTKGVIELEDGRPALSVEHLTQAREFAKKDRHTEELFWAEVRLLLAEFEQSPTKGFGSLLTDVKKHAIQIGDSVASIALHLFVSEIEAKKGALHNSRQHLKIARSLLRTYPNVWLEGLAFVCEFCLAYLVGDLEAADAAALESLRASHRSGHSRTELAAVINIGHVRLRQGKLEETNRLLRHALRLTSISTRVREYILDGLAQLALSRGHLERSAQFIEQLYDPDFPDPSYPKLWSYPTRTKLMLASDRAAAATELSTAGLELADEIGDRSLKMRLRLLRAEAAARAGDFEAAATDYQEAAFEHADPSLELVAECNRVGSLLLVASGDVDAATPGFDRGRRVLMGIGHARAAAEIQAPESAPPSGTANARSSERADVTAGRAAALFDQAARADLLGAELADLLFRVGAVRALALVATDGDGGAHLMSARGWSEAEAVAAIALKPPLPRLDLGSWRERQWSLVADVPSDITSRSAFVAVRTLAACSRTVDHWRKAERERSALWPMDPVDDATHGVFASESMLELVRTIRRVAQTPVTILLTGETGTGKDILARLVHEYSPRAGKMFVPFNCTAVPREMLDSQLFGHRRGAFTGAQEQSPGVIRGTQGGTLFLDEIGELGPEPQVKLLRFLESNEVHPIGEAHPVQVDVRVVAATNRDIETLVKDGLFREDFYYRLNVIRLRVPPLRERREEIPQIVEYYLTRLGPQFKKGHLTASAETMEYLLLHPWPGNVRQLANELRRAVAMAEQDAVIMPAHLSPDVIASRRTIPAVNRELLPTEFLVRLDQPLGAAEEHLERAMIHHAMTLANGHMDQAAQLLGLSRKGLYLKRQRLGLEPAGGGSPEISAQSGDDEEMPN